MTEQSLVLHIIYYLGAAIVAVPLFRRLGLGAILGYLVAGAVIGPECLHLIEDPIHALHFAEFGVVMLLFVIGLELKPEKLWQMRLQIGVLGGGQLLCCGAAIAALLMLGTGMDAASAALLGLTLGLSSTAFAIQLMGEQGVMGSELGRKGFAILLLQDLAVIPILLMVSLIAPIADSATANLSGWLGPLVVVAVLFIGRLGLGPVLRVVAESGSRELFTAAALLIVLGTALLMQAAGLTMGMGAFVAGIILANSSFRHQLEADIEPFKGLLLGLFFIAVGMTLNLQLFASHPLRILALAVTLMAVKTLLIAVLLKLSRASWRDSLLLGLLLSQGGEFAFVVMSKAWDLHLFSREVTDHVVLVVGVSMALTSPAILLYRRLSSLHHSRMALPAYDTSNDDEPEVIIAGFGRFGQIIGRILAANGMHFIALDKDASHVAFLKRSGNKIFFGDATRMNLLEAAGIDHARLLVVAVDDMRESLAIVHNVRKAYPNLMVIARAHNRAHAYQLHAEGVETVIRETLESSLKAALHTLMVLGYTEGQALEKIDLFRKHDERLLRRAIAHKDDLEELIKIADTGRRELEELFQRDAGLDK